MRFYAATMIALGLAIDAGSVSAQTTYIPGNGWQEFSWTNPSSSNDYRNSEGAFTFTVYAGQDAMLSVTDGWWNHEKIEIFNHGNWSEWTTSTEPPGTSERWTSSYDTAAASSSWSSGSWPLEPGTYELSFRLQQWSTARTDSPLSNIHSAAFKVDVLQTPDADGDGIADQFETKTGIYVSPVDTGTDPAKPDTDGDGINDWTEITSYATDPNLADTDGDGFKDRAEIEAGTSPTDGADSPDAVIELFPAIEFVFYSELGATYQIEWSLNAEDWTAYPEIITGDGNAIVRFYSTRVHSKRLFRAAKMANP